MQTSSNSSINSANDINRENRSTDIPKAAIEEELV